MGTKHGLMKQFRLNILTLLLSDVYVIKGNDCSFTDCNEKSNVKISMQCDVYELICFKSNFV